MVLKLDKNAIRLRIDIIEMNLNEIKKISKFDLLNYRDELALKHALLECIEACIDISNHIISVRGFRRPLDYSDVFVVLQENKIIDKSLSSRLQEMAKFRNVLVHRYALINKDKLLEIVKHDIKDINEFVKIVLKLVSK